MKKSEHSVFMFTVATNKIIIAHYYSNRLCVFIRISLFTNPPQSAEKTRFLTTNVLKT